MDVWLAVIGDADPEVSVIGAYSTKELAAAAAERVSPGDWYTTSFVLDKVPEWIDELEAEVEAERELLGHRSVSNAVRQQTTEGARAYPPD